MKKEVEKDMEEEDGEQSIKVDLGTEDALCLSK